MSESEGIDGTGIPTRTVHEAYRRCLDARKEYIRARRHNPELQNTAHKNLQDAVQEYFEALYELLTTEEAVEEYWGGSEDAYLWTKERYYITVGDERIPADDLPKDKLAKIDLQEDAEKGVEYVGLRALDGEFSHTETVEKDVSVAYGAYKVSEERANLLPVATLFKAARLLNQAAKELHLLVNVEETTPRTEIDDELIEEWEEWRQQNI